MFRMRNMLAARSVFVIVALYCSLQSAQAFSTPYHHHWTSRRPVSSPKATLSTNQAAVLLFTRSNHVHLKAAPSDENVNQTRRKRRRKQFPTNVATNEDSALQQDDEEDDDQEDELSEQDILEISKVAKFEFKQKDNWNANDEAVANDVDRAGNEGTIPLPDIREARMKKVQEAVEKEMEPERVKIKRGDTKALRELMELQPFADADESNFEAAEYGTVSALLGEGAKPFLGIPPGPLQVGHFIGALVIVLMAFVQYPGFPLTNLPTPVRDALQGGLGCVFAVNIALAVTATSKAEERGQSKVLWAMKTVSVGGLAIDQLSQLPTLEQIERAKTRKGKRAVKKQK